MATDKNHMSRVNGNHSRWLTGSTIFLCS